MVAGTLPPKLFTVGANVILLLALTSAIAACLWNSEKVSSPTNLRWRIYALSQVFIGAGMLIMGLGIWSSPPQTYLADIPRVLILLGAASALFAITGSFRSNDPVSVKWIDWFSIFLMVALFFVFTFSAATHHSSTHFSIQTLDLRTIFLALSAAIQLSVADDPAEQRFLYAAVVHTWIGGAVITIHNHIPRYAALRGIDFGFILPPLILIAVALWPVPERIRNYRPSLRAARIAQAGGPCLMGLALVLLGIGVYRIHFYVGLSSIICSMLLYGLRNALVQGRLLETEEELRLASKELDGLVIRDALTGIANRRAFDRVLDREWRVAIRTGAPLSLLLIDVDHFKRLNDTYGHIVGDQCLVEIAALLQHMLPRASDLLCRYGGEEFAVILPTTNGDGALTVAERLRKSVAKDTLSSIWPSTDNVTISIGTTTAEELTETSSQTDLIRAADKGLYLAKRSGRNCIRKVAFEDFVEQLPSSPQPEPSLGAT
jgi:diguanylate cyclase (GGDEF)-like protein